MIPQLHPHQPTDLPPPLPLDHISLDRGSPPSFHDPRSPYYSFLEVETSKENTLIVGQCPVVILYFVVVLTDLQMQGLRRASTSVHWLGCAPPCTQRKIGYSHGSRLSCQGRTYLSASTKVGSHRPLASEIATCHEDKVA